MVQPFSQAVINIIISWNKPKSVKNIFSKGNLNSRFSAKALHISHQFCFRIQQLNQQKEEPSNFNKSRSKLLQFNPMKIEQTQNTQTKRLDRGDERPPRST